MSEAIIVAIITGGFTLFGVLISNSKKDGAIEERLNELTREVLWLGEFNHSESN